MGEKERLKRAGAWRQVLRERLPLLGHRNWIVVADAAFPCFANPGLEAIHAGGGLLKTARHVLRQIDAAAHVRPRLHVARELDFVTDADAPGAAACRAALSELLATRDVQPLGHAELLRQLDEVSRVYRILMVKTDETIPYTSLFLRLECGYWGDDAEARMRDAMRAPDQDAPHP